MAVMAVAEGYPLREFLGWTPRFFVSVMRVKMDAVKYDRLLAEWGPAMVSFMLAEIHRNPKKKRKPWSVKDFMLSAQQQQRPKRKQTWQDQLKIIMAYHKAWGGTGRPPAGVQ